MSGRITKLEANAWSDPAKVARETIPYLRRQLDTLEYLHERKARPKLETPVARSLLRGLQVLHNTRRARGMKEETIVV